MFCPKCGTQILEEAEFCQKCGTKLIIDTNKEQKMLMEQGTVEPKESKNVQLSPSKVTKDKDSQESADNGKASTGKSELFGNKRLGKYIVAAALLIFMLIIVLTSPIVRIVLTLFAAVIGVIAKFRSDPKKLVVGIGIAIVAVIVAIAVFGKNNSQNDKYILMVKNGTLEAYPQKTVGEAFDNYLANAVWESGKSEGGQRFVNVRGEILYDGNNAEIIVQFFVDENNGLFMYNACEINGIPQNDWAVFYLFDTVFNYDSAATTFDSKEDSYNTH